MPDPAQAQLEATPSTNSDDLARSRKKRRIQMLRSSTEKARKLNMKKYMNIETRLLICCTNNNCSRFIKLLEHLSYSRDDSNSLVTLVAPFIALLQCYASSGDRRGSVVVSMPAYHAATGVQIPLGPGVIIRCKNTALYI